MSADATRAAIRGILKSAQREQCLDEMMRILASCGGLPRACEQGLAKAEAEKYAARTSLKSLKEAVYSARPAARLSRPRPMRGLAIPTPEEKRLTVLEALVSDASADLARRTQGGRPTVYGAKHLAMAVWGVLHRAGLPDRQRAGVTRNCLTQTGVAVGQIETAVRYARRWFKKEKTPL